MFSRKYPMEIQETRQHVFFVSLHGQKLSHLPTKIIFGDVFYQNNQYWENKNIL
jgi:hypothetical protein